MSIVWIINFVNLLISWLEKYQRQSQCWFSQCYFLTSCSNSQWRSCRVWLPSFANPPANWGKPPVWFGGAVCFWDTVEGSASVNVCAFSGQRINEQLRPSQVSKAFQRPNTATQVCGLIVVCARVFIVRCALQCCLSFRFNLLKNQLITKATGPHQVQA